MSNWLMSGFLLGVAFTAGDWLDATSEGTAAIAVSIAIGAALLGMAIGISAAAGLLVVGWVFCLVVQIELSDHDVWATIGVPFVLTAFVVGVLRTRRIAAVLRSAPLILPVALSVLVVPIFTADLWSAVADLTVGNLVLLACVSVIPLLVVVHRRLSTDIGRTVDLAAADLDPDLARTQLESDLVGLLDEDERDEARTDVSRLVGRYWDPWDPAPVAGRIANALRAQLMRNLALSALGLAGLASSYMGALAWILIPQKTATAWSGGAIRNADIGVLGLTINVPLGPYVTLAILLGVLTTAVLLASVAVDDDYAERLGDALLRPAADTALMCGVPYLRVADTTARPVALAD